MLGREIPDLLSAFSLPGHLRSPFHDGRVPASFLRRHDAPHEAYKVCYCVPRLIHGLTDWIKHIHINDYLIMQIYISEYD